MIMYMVEVKNVKIAILIKSLIFNLFAVYGSGSARQNIAV